MTSESLIRCVQLQLGKRNVKMTDRFIEDLGAESIDILHIVAAVEKLSGVPLPEELIHEFLTLQDLYNYINKESVS